MDATRTRNNLFIILRLALLLTLSLVAANFLNEKNYNDFFSRMLIRIHAEKGMGVDTRELADLLVRKDYETLQRVLDRNHNVFALVVTDCKSLEEECPAQRVLFSTNQGLIRNRELTPAGLSRYPFAVLYRPTASVLDLLQKRERLAPPGEVLGRVYSINTIPSFEEDYRLWLTDPFRDNELWRNYLTTTLICLLCGLSVWCFVELVLKNRRMERRNAELREAALIREADNVLRQLEEKESQLADQERRYQEQHGAYVGRIRDLEQKLQHVAEYRSMSDTIIRELEEENRQQSENFRREVDLVTRQKTSLQEEMARYRAASSRDKAEASRALEHVIAPQFENLFEKRIFTLLQESPKGRAGEWRLMAQFDVAPGSSTSQVADCVVLSKDCVVVIEAKNYQGTIEAEGDTENTRWHCRSLNGSVVAVTSNWGINPYQQVRQYAAGVMKLGKRGEWKLPVFGVVVFAEGTDLDRVGTKIGKYYRLTTSERLVGLLNGIEAEARRENVHSRRPTPEQIERLLLGKL